MRVVTLLLWAHSRASRFWRHIPGQLHLSASCPLRRQPICLVRTACPRAGLRLHGLRRPRPLRDLLGFAGTVLRARWRAHCDATNEGHWARGRTGRDRTASLRPAPLAEGGAETDDGSRGHGPQRPRPPRSAREERPGAPNSYSDTSGFHRAADDVDGGCRRPMPRSRRSSRRHSLRLRYGSTQSPVPRRSYGNSEARPEGRVHQVRWDSDRTQGTVQRCHPHGGGIDRLEGTATYGVGSGIVWDSRARREYRECLAKARVLTADARAFCLLETMRWEPGQGFYLLERRLRRQAASARFFGISYDVSRVRRLLDAGVGGTETLRIRLLVDEAGEPTIESAPLLRLRPATPRVGLGTLLRSISPIPSSSTRRLAGPFMSGPKHRGRTAIR